MKFTAVIAPGLLEPLGSTSVCEGTLREVFEDTLWSTTLPRNRERNIRVEAGEGGTFSVDLDLNQRDAEVVKDMLYESLMVYFDPDFASDIDVEINNEL